LEDDEGVFGSPYGAVARARASTKTRRALLVAFLPAGVDPGTTVEVLEAIARHVGRACGGREWARHVIPAPSA
ncbi:MAG: hypothetical protein ACC662_01650, partial [Planctomycetota bacterium]